MCGNRLKIIDQLIKSRNCLTGAAEERKTRQELLQEEVVAVKRKPPKEGRNCRNEKMAWDILRSLPSSEQVA